VAFLLTVVVAPLPLKNWWGSATSISNYTKVRFQIFLFGISSVSFCS